MTLELELLPQVCMQSMPWSGYNEVHKLLEGAVVLDQAILLLVLTSCNAPFRLIPFRHDWFHAVIVISLFSHPISYKRFYVLYPGLMMPSIWKTDGSVQPNCNWKSLTLISTFMKVHKFTGMKVNNVASRIKKFYILAYDLVILIHLILLHCH